jgi:Holliday junction resolvasome RuvABC endonuclease subunit
VLGLDLGTRLGVCTVFVDGEIDAQALRFESDIGSRTVGVANIIKRHAGPDCLGVCIEEPFSGQFSSVKALFPMLGAAVLACELAGLPWSAVHLSKLKIHATGKGNAKKPDMQAAAKARWGRDLGEDEADAAWAGAYALDHNLFA